MRINEGAKDHVSDSLTVEAALHVRINDIAYTTTLRTPGADRDLVHGLLFTEGIITDAEVPVTFHEIEDPETGYTGCIELTVPGNVSLTNVEGRRSSISTASCGFCGLREPRHIELSGPPLDQSGRFGPARLPGMFRAMKASQPAFNGSGGCHGAAAFTLDGQMLAVFEDIGRHNAVDKVIGRLWKSGALNKATCLLVSGRVSYEIVFKAYRAGVPFIAAVSAPSSMAVNTAQRFGITLMAFCRGSRATVYTNPARVNLSPVSSEMAATPAS